MNQATFYRMIREFHHDFTNLNPIHFRYWRQSGRGHRANWPMAWDRIWTGNRLSVKKPGDESSAIGCNAAPWKYFIGGCPCAAWSLTNSHWKTWNGGSERIRRALRILKLIQTLPDNPFKGIGKPEALKNNFAGAWSRRINDEHRLIYQVFDEKIRIIACRFHYDD